MSLAAPARLLVHPFRGYEELARQEDGPTITGGAARLLFVIGTVVAISAAGRLAPVELVVAAFSFAYVPLIQLLALALALRAVSKAAAIPRAFALYLAGHGPWLVALLTIAAICLLAPSPATALAATVPFLVLGALLWGTLLTYACFRHGLGLSRRHAAAGTGLHVLALTAMVVSYFLAMGQLGPLILL